jgi:hypothetical protein
VERQCLLSFRSADYSNLDVLSLVADNSGMAALCCRTLQCDGLIWKA